MIAEYICHKVSDAEALVRAYGVAAESLKGSSHGLGFERNRCAEAPSEFILRK